jgi:predicted transcriptional regulator
MDEEPALDYQRIQRRAIRREKVDRRYWRVWVGDGLLADGVSRTRSWLIAAALRIVLR